MAPMPISIFDPVKIRGKELSWFYAAIPAGTALGFALGGQIKNSLGLRRPFYLAVVAGILLLVLFMRTTTRTGRQPRCGPRLRWKDYLGLLRIPSYVLDTLGMTAMGLCFGSGHGCQSDPAAACSSPRAPRSRYCFACPAGRGRLHRHARRRHVGDKLRTRFSGSYFLVSGIAMFLGFPIVLLVVHSDLATWVYIFLAMFFLFFRHGPNQRDLGHVDHPSIRATVFALEISVLHAFGDAISPTLIGVIADHYGEVPATPRCTATVSASWWYRS